MSNGTLKAAIKTLKGNADHEQRKKFFTEAVIMGQFYHRNVVQLYGVVLTGNPVRKT